MSSRITTAKIPFDAPPKRKRNRRAKSVYPCRNLAVEHLSYNLEGGDYATCPLIRLKGRWLARAGFTVGSHVVVTVRRGRLTIRPDNRSVFVPQARAPSLVRTFKGAFAPLKDGDPHVFAAETVLCTDPLDNGSQRR